MDPKEASYYISSLAVSERFWNRHKNIRPICVSIIRSRKVLQAFLQQVVQLLQKACAQSSKELLSLALFLNKLKKGCGVVFRLFVYYLWSGKGQVLFGKCSHAGLMISAGISIKKKLTSQLIFNLISIRRMILCSQAYLRESNRYVLLLLLESILY